MLGALPDPVRAVVIYGNDVRFGGMPVEEACSILHSTFCILHSAFVHRWASGKIGIWADRQAISLRSANGWQIVVLFSRCRAGALSGAPEDLATNAREPPDLDTVLFIERAKSTLVTVMNGHWSHARVVA